MAYLSPSHFIGADMEAQKPETIGNPNKNEIKNDLKEENKPHATILGPEALKHSGKDDNQITPSIKSIAPATGKKVDWSDKDKEYKILTDLSALIGDDGDEDYPYEKLKVEQGFFIPTQPNQTTDQLLAKLNKSIDTIKKRYGEIEVNDEGDKIMEHITVETRKRNDDGTVKMDGDKPKVGANFTQRYKYNYTRNFVAKPVYAGQKLAEGVEAEGDGVVVIRVA